MIELRGDWPQYEHYRTRLNAIRGFDNAGNQIQAKPGEARPPLPMHQEMGLSCGTEPYSEERVVQKAKEYQKMREVLPTPPALPETGIAANLIMRLAKWSIKYPRSGIYSMGSTMDAELIAMEKEAKEWAALQGPEGGVHG
jgi:hypothetical protein